MTKFEEAKLSMYEATLEFLKDPLIVAIYSVSSGVTAAVNDFETKVNKLNEYRQGQMQTSKGATVTKSSQRTDLVNETMLAANAIKSYANAAKNFNLAAQATLQRSAVKKLPDTELSNTAKSIYALANANSGFIKDYNYPDTQLPVFNAAIVAFDTKMQAPKNIIGSKKTSTTNLKAGFTDADVFLDDVLDPAILTYSNTQAQFVSDYFNVRVIFDVGGQKLSARFVVTESVNNTALANVSIVITPGNIKKKTTTKGQSTVKGLSDGSYTATFSKPGFVTQTKSFNVVSTETAVVLVSMAGS